MDLKQSLLHSEVKEHEEDEVLPEFFWPSSMPVSKDPFYEIVARLEAEGAFDEECVGVKRCSRLDTDSNEQKTPQQIKQ